MGREYVLASGNPGKLHEMTDMFEPLGLVVRPQSDWQVPDAEETAATFVENSMIKARQAVHYTGLPSIADDSGLVVPALNGEPGIFSARYAGEGGDARANMRKLLAELKGKTGSDRNAYFYCVMVLVDSIDDPVPLIATGSWQGRILESPQGEGGFGYDPLFGITRPSDSGQQRSAAEMTAAEKGHVSHRGQALRQLVRQLCDRDGGSIA
jgi:XTP/dITP diphosphohydrolase